MAAPHTAAEPIVKARPVAGYVREWIGVDRHCIERRPSRRELIDFVKIGLDERVLAVVDATLIFVLLRGALVIKTWPAHFFCRWDQDAFRRPHSARPPADALANLRHRPRR
jgi:hypothetical protein